MSIEERIQELRKSKGLSQEQLADILGVSRQAVSKWEGGQSLPEIEKLLSMSELFGVTTDYILKGEKAPEQRGDRSAEVGSQIVSAVAAMLLIIAIVAAMGKLNEGSETIDIYGGLVIESVGVMLMLAGWFIAGNRILNKPLYVVSVLLAGVLPSLLVPQSVYDLKAETLFWSVGAFFRTPGVFWLFTAAYAVLCGGILYLTVLRKQK